MHRRNSRFGGFGVTDRKQENLSETVFQRGFALLCPFCFGLLERKTSHEPAFAGISRELYLHPPTPERGEWGRCGRVIVANNTKRKKQPVWTAFLRLSGKREFNPIVLTI